MTWRPMRPATVTTDPARVARNIALMVEKYGVDEDEAVEMNLGQELWRNDKYVATVTRGDDRVVHWIAIRNDDRSARRDWRAFQQIKNDIAGPEAEAVELYPAESRLVDASNQFHLWCFPVGHRLPLGFPSGQVADVEEAAVFGAVQRRLGVID